MFPWEINYIYFSDFKVEPTIIYVSVFYEDNSA